MKKYVEKKDGEILVCPYCDTEKELTDLSPNTNELDYRGSYDGQAHCNNCKSIYGYNIEVEYKYSSFKMPCHNGGNHKWRKVYKNIKECIFCKKRKE